MNFLSMAANKLANRVEDKMRSPDTPFARIADRFGLTHPEIATPAGLQNPEQLQRGMMRITQQVPGAESAAATPEQEAFAQKNGFRNYGEMLAWAKQRAQRRDRTADGRVANTGQSGVMATIENAIRNPGEAWDTMMSIHPKNMFENILERWRGATQEQ